MKMANLKYLAIRYNHLKMRKQKLTELPEETDKAHFLEAGPWLSEHSLPSSFSRRHSVQPATEMFPLLTAPSSHLAVTRLCGLALIFLCSAGGRALQPLGSSQ